MLKLSSLSHEVNLLSQYLNEIGKFKILTKGEEAELFRKYQAGDRDARTLLINSSLRLVVSIAKKYSNPKLPILDLIQEGNIGLIAAIEKFDLSKDLRLSSYATWWIKKYVLEFLEAKSALVKKPGHITIKINKIKKFRKAHLLEHGKDASYELLAEHLELSIKKIKQLEEIYSTEFVSIEGDSLFDLGDYTSVNDFEKFVEYNNLKEEIEKLSDERERQVIILRHGLNDDIERTFEEVGKFYGISKSRTKQIYDGALKKIRVNSRRD